MRDFPSIACRILTCLTGMQRYRFGEECAGGTVPPQAPSHSSQLAFLGMSIASGLLPLQQCPHAFFHHKSRARRPQRGRGEESILIFYLAKLTRALVLKLFDRGPPHPKPGKVAENSDRQISKMIPTGGVNIKETPHAMTGSGRARKGKQVQSEDLI